MLLKVIAKPRGYYKASSVTIEGLNEGLNSSDYLADVEKNNEVIVSKAFCLEISIQIANN